MKAQELGLTKIVPAAGWTASLSDGQEWIYDAHGNLEQELTFNADGSVSVANSIVIADSNTSVTVNNNDAQSGAGQNIAISLTGSNDTVSTGFGNNAISITGSGNHVTAQGNDTVRLTGSGNTLGLTGGGANSSMFPGRARRSTPPPRRSCWRRARRPSSTARMTTSRSAPMRQRS